MRDIRDEDGTEDHANGDAEERERADAEVPAALFLEGDGVGFEEEVQQTVDEGHVEGEEEEDWFLDQHSKRAKQVAIYNVGKSGLLFVDLGVESPVLGLVAACFGTT